MQIRKARPAQLLRCLVLLCVCIGEGMPLLSWSGFFKKQTPTPSVEEVCALPSLNSTRTVALQGQGLLSLLAVSVQMAVGHDDLFGVDFPKQKSSNFG